MRYLNWDVLLFPSDSRTPIQEFDTKWHVITEIGCSGPQGSVSINGPFLDTFDSMTKLPTLTCFVSSLTPGQPFRVSIHSWDRPQASSLLKAYRATEECIMFQARVCLDGVQHASRTFQEDNLWPEVIDSSSEHCNLDGRKVLRFPRFHEEILQQAHWDASEPMGRIRVIISEGVVRETSPPEPQRFIFDRLRDVIAFSFQHAPNHILEYSGIAWPNKAMFERPPRELTRREPIGRRIPAADGHELHSHSPQKPRLGMINRHGLVNPDAVYPINTRYGRRTAFNEPTITQSAGMLPMDDPFVGSSSVPIHQWRSQLRASSQDLSMVDYISNKTSGSHANTDMSGVSFGRRDFQKHMNEAAIDEIVQALSPTRKDLLLSALSPSKICDTGIEPPSSTPALTRHKQPRIPSIKTTGQTQRLAQLPLSGLYSLARAPSPASPRSTRSVTERRFTELDIKLNNTASPPLRSEGSNASATFLLQGPDIRRAESHPAVQHKRAVGQFSAISQRVRSDSGSKRVRVVSPSNSEEAAQKESAMLGEARTTMKDQAPSAVKEGLK